MGSKPRCGILQACPTRIASTGHTPERLACSERREMRRTDDVPSKPENVSSRFGDQSGRARLHGWFHVGTRPYSRAAWLKLCSKQREPGSTRRRGPPHPATHHTAPFRCRRPKPWQNALDIDRAGVTSHERGRVPVYCTLPYSSRAWSSAHPARVLGSTERDGLYPARLANANSCADIFGTPRLLAQLFHVSSRISHLFAQFLPQHLTECEPNFSCSLLGTGYSVYRVLCNLTR